MMARSSWPMPSPGRSRFASAVPGSPSFTRRPVRCMASTLSARRASSRRSVRQYHRRALGVLLSLPAVLPDTATSPRIERDDRTDHAPGRCGRRWPRVPWSWRSSLPGTPVGEERIPRAWRHRRDPRPTRAAARPGQRNAADEAALETPAPGDLRPRRAGRGVPVPGRGRRRGGGHVRLPRDGSGHLPAARGGHAVHRPSCRTCCPPARWARARYWLEATFAVVFLAVLMGLTGGLHSPFFVGFFLLVGGAALSVEGLAPVALGADGRVRLRRRGGAGAGPRRVGRRRPGLDRLQPRGPGPARVHRHGRGRREQRRAREAAAPPVALRPADRPLQPQLLLRGDGARDPPVRAHGSRLLRADARPRRPQARERHVRTPVRRPAAAERRRTCSSGPCAPPTRPPATAATSSWCCCPRPTRTAPSWWPRSCAATSRRWPSGWTSAACARPCPSGLVAFPDDGGTIEQLVSAVDAAMYEAKRRGKNQIVGYTTRTERVATSIGIGAASCMPGHEVPAGMSRDRASSAGRPHRTPPT